MNKKFEAQMEKRNKEFKQFTDQMNRQAARREQETRKQLENQRAYFSQMMEMSEKSHQRTMSMLQQQMEKDSANYK